MYKVHVTVGKNFVLKNGHDYFCLNLSLIFNTHSELVCLLFLFNTDHIVNSHLQSLASSAFHSSTEH